MKIRKEIKAAAIFVVAIGLLIWGLNFMKGSNLFVKETTFYAVYDQVSGLSINNPVSINGYEVGLVRNIDFMPEDTAGNVKLIVRMGITEDIKIPKNSIARIETDLLGSNIVNIRFGKSDEYLQSGDTLSSELATTLQEQFNLTMLPIRRKAENLMLSIDTVLTVIRYVFNEETRDNLARSFESIRVSIDRIKHTSYNIDTLITSQRNRLAGIVGNIHSISQNLEENNEAVSHIINNFSNVSDSLAAVEFGKTLRRADKAITDIATLTDRINSGEGSLGKLLNNDSLYNNLDKSAKEISQLVEDIKLNPRRYLHFSVFGRNSSKDEYTPPDAEVKEED